MCESLLLCHVSGLPWIPFLLFLFTSNMAPKPGVVVHTYIPNTLRGWARRIASSSPAWDCHKTNKQTKSWGYSLVPKPWVQAQVPLKTKHFKSSQTLPVSLLHWGHSFLSPYLDPCLSLPLAPATGWYFVNKTTLTILFPVWFSSGTYAECFSLHPSLPGLEAWAPVW